MQGLVTPAPAKINLVLRVLERRTDGFHDIDTLFQAIDLADQVEVSLTDGSIDLEVHGPDLGPVEQNLAWRAAEGFLSAAGSTRGVRIVLHKAIPAGGGLGGGSSDAGAVLRALDTLIGGVDPVAVARLAGRLGSDVPFFLGPRPLAHGAGRGEVLTDCPALPARELLIGLPPVHVATGPAYGALAAARSGGAPISGPMVPEDRPTSWSEVAALAENDFESFAKASHPEVERTLEAFRGCDPELAMLSGSGAACFAVLREGAAAAALAGELTDRLGWSVVASRTLTEWPESGRESTSESRRG